MDFHTQDCSSQDGKAGREFILFVGLILSSVVRNTWRQSAELRKEFKTSLSILDEMADIRWVQYGDGEEHLTSFLSKQVEICKAYGIDVPPECLSSTERLSGERKRNPKSPGRKPNGTPAPNKITVTKCWGRQQPFYAGDRAGAWSIAITFHAPRSADASVFVSTCWSSQFGV